MIFSEFHTLPPEHIPQILLQFAWYNLYIIKETFFNQTCKISTLTLKISGFILKISMTLVLHRGLPIRTWLIFFYDFHSPFRTSMDHFNLLDSNNTTAQYTILVIIPHINCCVLTFFCCCSCENFIPIFSFILRNNFSLFNIPLLALDFTFQTLTIFSESNNLALRTYTCVISFKYLM